MVLVPELGAGKKGNSTLTTYDSKYRIAVAMNDTSRVLGLRRLDIYDPDWQKAMTAITESAQIFRSNQYLCFYERND